jgi:hypothetical protein
MAGNIGLYWKGKKKANQFSGLPHGAEDEVRTRDLQLGKLPLYQLSYFRVKREFTI